MNYKRSLHLILLILVHQILLIMHAAVLRSQEAVTIIVHSSLQFI